MSSSSSLHLVCPLCDHPHTIPALRAGERAQCVRCDTILARGTRWGKDGALAFAVTGAFLAVPATVLPLVEVSKFQAERASYAFGGVRALWDADMRLLAVWVFLCALAVPFLLLGTLLGLLLPPRLGWSLGAAGWLGRCARAFERWAMPEVNMLAMLVAFAKLGSLVDVRPGAGLWCYAAMAACVLIAWRSFELDQAPRWFGAPARTAADQP